VLHLLERIESLNRKKKSTSLSLRVAVVHAHGGVAVIQTKETAARKIDIEGLRNIFFLAIILGAVFIERPPFLREATMR